MKFTVVQWNRSQNYGEQFHSTNTTQKYLMRNINNTTSGICLWSTEMKNQIFLKAPFFTHQSEHIHGRIALMETFMFMLTLHSHL
jgi:hypothetical protein